MDRNHQTFVNINEATEADFRSDPPGVHEVGQGISANRVLGDALRGCYRTREFISLWQRVDYLGDRVMATTMATATDPAVRPCQDFLERLMVGYGPRDFSIQFWNATTLGPEGGRPSRFTLVLQHQGAASTKMFMPPVQLSLGESCIYSDFDIDGDFEAFLISSIGGSPRASTRLLCNLIKLRHGRSQVAHGRRRLRGVKLGTNSRGRLIIKNAIPSQHVPLRHFQRLLRALPRQNSECCTPPAISDPDHDVNPLSARQARSRLPQTAAQ